MPRPASIVSIRRQIDRIDDQLLRLLNRRARLALAVAAQKAAPSRGDVRAGARARCPVAASRDRTADRSSRRTCARSSARSSRRRAASSSGCASPTSARRRRGRTWRRASSSAPRRELRAVADGRATSSATSSAGAPSSASCRSRTRPRAWSRDTLDLLVDSPLAICAEVTAARPALPARAPGTALAAMRRVVAHPQALAQCRQLAGSASRRACRTVEEASNASAAARAATRARHGGDRRRGGREPPTASHVLAPRHPGRDRQRHALPRARPRRTASRPSGDDKTSIVLSACRDEVGVLARMLRPFATHRIDLSKIESRPLRERPWEYYFFLDLKGHRREARVARALAAVRAARAAAQGAGLVPGGARPGGVMTVDIRQLVPEWIRTLTPYPPGKPIEELEREFGIQRLDQAGVEREPARSVADARSPPCAAALGDMHRYPDGSALLPAPPARASGTACRRTTSSSATARTRSSSWSCAPSCGRATRR